MSENKQQKNKLNKKNNASRNTAKNKTEKHDSTLSENTNNKNSKNNIKGSKHKTIAENVVVDFDVTKLATASEEERQEIYEKYNKYVEKKSPKTKNFPTLLYSFLVGGIICMIGQGIVDGLTAIFPTLPLEQANAWMLIILIFIASFLTAIGVYDKIGEFAGAGSIVPITGFSNSITSPAVEFKREGIIFGLCVKMFTVAGPVIVNGVTISLITGLVYYFILL